ncbi:hypothetical protein ACFQ1S_34575 [Kibdelosporangium lantanae]|uniref:Cell division protein SepF n=1 Tax=Kibdelosporangium lantanae TaxID=1497396 RepID=A0ABW3MHQ6_9PSEU
MSALQKLKAYFGMVPADDEDYEVDDDRYQSYRSDGYRSEYADDDYSPYPERGARRRRSGYRDDVAEDEDTGMECEKCGSARENCRTGW